MDLTTLLSLISAVDKMEEGFLSYILMGGVTVLCIYYVYNQINSTKQQTGKIKEILAMTEETKEQIAQELKQTRKHLTHCQEGQDELHDRINKLNHRLGKYAEEMQELRERQK